MIVREVIEKIIKKCQIPALEKTCDLLIAGDWQCEVSGIVTTFMATVNVIRDAIAMGANLIITHEPTFFTSWDKTDWLEHDPVYLEKQKLIQDHRIHIWRFHDHMHMTEPDLVYAGLIRELGWQSYRDPKEKHCFTIPKTTVKGLSEFLKQTLRVRVSRIVGTVDGSVERVGILVGGGSLGLGREEMPMELMQNARLDTLVCGEIYEWTLPAYVRDASQLGMNKSLIVLGHNRTEEIGMKYLVDWLKEDLADIPIRFIEAGEPFTYQ